MSKKRYRIIANSSQTKFRIQYQKETFISKLASVFSPGVMQEFEWVNVDNIIGKYTFSNYIRAEAFLQELIQDEIDEDEETWTVVKSSD